MPRRKTHEEFVLEVKEKFPLVEVRGEYTHSCKDIQFYCKSCGYLWMKRPSGFLQSTGCPRCSRKMANNKKRMSNDLFVSRMDNLHPDLIMIDEYFNNSTKVTYVCTVCGETQDNTPLHLLAGEGCSRCSMEKAHYNHRKTHDEFIGQLRKVHNDISVLSRYQIANKKVMVRHDLCGHEWEATPASLLSGTGCPLCRSSHGERAIDIYLHDHNIPHEHQKTYSNLTGIGGRSLSYDFFISTKNILLEYQGQYHDGSTNIQTLNEYLTQQEHDRRKAKYAKDNNITLLEIWYYQFEDIEKILTEKLLQSPLTITA